MIRPQLFEYNGKTDNDRENEHVVSEYLVKIEPMAVRIEDTDEDAVISQLYELIKAGQVDLVLKVMKVE